MHRGRTALTRMYSLGGGSSLGKSTKPSIWVLPSRKTLPGRHISTTLHGKPMPRSPSCGVTFVFCPRELREQAYFTLVHSIIENSASVWDPRYKKGITTLDKVQRRAARFVVRDSSWRSSVTAMLQNLSWKSLGDRRRDIRLALFFKAVHGLAAVPTSDTLTKADKRMRSNHPFKFRHILAYRLHCLPSDRFPSHRTSVE